MGTTSECAQTTVAHVCDVLALVVVPDKGGERGRKGSPAKPKNVRKSGERAHWYSISSSPPRRATGGFRKRPKQKHVRQTVATGQKSVIRVSRVFVVSARVKNEQELPAFPAHKKMSPVFSTHIEASLEHISHVALPQSSSESHRAPCPRVHAKDPTLATTQLQQRNATWSRVNREVPQRIWPHISQLYFQCKRRKERYRLFFL